MPDRLNSNSNPNLYPGNSLNSPNGRAKFSALDTGDVAVYASVDGVDKLIWHTDTDGQEYGQVCMTNSGEVAVFKRGSADTIWKSGTWNSGQPGPYELVMQDDGNLVAYASNGVSVWNTATHVSPPPIAFSRVRWINGGQGTIVNPIIKDGRGDEVLWDSGAIGSFWTIAQDHEMEMDFDEDIGERIGGDGTHCSLGFHLFTGRYDWVDPFRTAQFVYKKDSKVRVTIRKWGSIAGGDAAFDEAVAI